jgi:LysM repeat protein
LFSCSLLIATAQVTVPLSENKVIIEGSVFYMHIVKAGQTLFSISKAYGLSEHDIVKENPGADLGLQIGQILKIPVLKSNEKAAPIDVPPDTLYRSHVVKQAETMYSISKYYNVSIDEIERINPSIRNHEIKIGQIILIPREKIEVNSEDFISHKVKRKETIYGISRFYGISEEVLKQYNPELYNKLPKNGQVLNIPKIVKSEISVDTSNLARIDSASFTIFQGYDTARIAANYTFYLDSMSDVTGKTLNVAYLIPFNYHKIDEVIIDESEDKTKDDIMNLDYTVNPDDQMLSSRNLLEFLEGSLLAIDRLKNEGVNVNIFVFDTRKSPTRIREIINSIRFLDINLIIGPFYSYEVEIVSEYSRINHLPMISPFTVEPGSVQSNPYLFQINTGFMTEFNCMAEYLSACTDKNIVFIHGTDSLELEKYNFLKTNFLKRTACLSNSDSFFMHEIIFDMKVKASLLQDFDSLLSVEKENLVIIPETDEAFVSTVISQLYFQLKNFRVSVVGMPHWNTFQNVDFMYFHKLSLSYFTPYYFSYDSADVKKFLKDFRKTFYAEPVTLTKKGGSYAFLGYDLSYHFLKSMSKYQKRFILHLNDDEDDELMNVFHFLPVSDTGGFENSSLMLVKFFKNLDIQAEPYSIPLPFEKTNSVQIIRNPHPN